MSDQNPNPQVTQLLIELRNELREAFSELIPLVYEDLRRIARSHMRRPGSLSLPGHDWNGGGLPPSGPVVNGGFSS